MKKPTSPHTSQDFQHLEAPHQKLTLQKEASNISFDQNLFESLNLAKVESKNYNLLIDQDPMVYPGNSPHKNLEFPLIFLVFSLEFDRGFDFYKNSSNLNNNAENPAAVSGVRKSTRKSKRFSAFFYIKSRKYSEK